MTRCAMVVVRLMHACQVRAKALRWRRVCGGGGGGGPRLIHASLTTVLTMEMGGLSDLVIGEVAEIGEVEIAGEVGRTIEDGICAFVTMWVLDREEDVFALSKSGRTGGRGESNRARRALKITEFDRLRGKSGMRHTAHGIFGLRLGLDTHAAHSRSVRDMGR